jgi:hypothetical protein
MSGTCTAKGVDFQLQGTARRSYFSAEVLLGHGDIIIIIIIMRPSTW